MFIKFGIKQHLENLMTNGAMWFNPCIKFREWKITEGIKDSQDGGFKLTAEYTHFFDTAGNFICSGNKRIGLIMNPAQQTPIFCLYKANDKIEIINSIADIKAEFPNYDYALIIDNEYEFLENIRFSFRNKAFCHKIFYQDELSVEFVDFLFDGTSDTLFFKPKNKVNPYAYCEYRPLNGVPRRLNIDDSNFYKTMYSKNLNYSKQSEYRIVLPYNKIKEGKYFYIKPFKADLIQISNLEE